MRFDDRLATVLAQPRDDAAACAIVWRQVVDILAQTSVEAGAMPAPDVVAVMRGLHDGVPLPTRVAAAAALAGRRVHPVVVMLIAGDRSAKVASLIGRVRLDDMAWLALLPCLPVTARALLRERRDLSPLVRIGLACFGPSDFALPAPPPSPPSPGPGKAGPLAQMPPMPVGEGMTDAGAPEGPSAIEPSRPSAILVPADTDHAAPATSAVPRIGDTPCIPSPDETFRFETGPDGVIVWVDGAPRAALIGVTIAPVIDPAGPGPARPGADGQTADAFHHRASFRDARLVVAVRAAVSGW
ncbi:sensor histidine kinase, partial [Sphingomonas solaris]